MARPRFLMQLTRDFANLLTKYDPFLNQPLQELQADGAADGELRRLFCGAHILFSHSFSTATDTK